MRELSAATSPDRAAVLFAASLTLLVAILADLLAGERPFHTATLAALAVVVAMLRLKLANRHHNLFRAASGAIVAQPALHAATKLLPTAAENAAPHAAGQAEVSVSLAHVVVAALIVLAVSGAEQLFALSQPLVRWLRLLTPSIRYPAAPVVPATAPSAMLAVRWLHIARTPRRGPPAAITAAAL